MVAVDEHGRPVPVPPLIAETDEDIKRQQDADVRREERIRIRQRLEAGS
jgi:acyl-CoA hydrolase